MSIFPIRANIETGRRPFISYLLIAINVVIFVMQMVSPRGMVNQQFRLYGFTPMNLFGYGARTLAISPWLTLITSQFLHGNLGHILSNMLYLWVFGNSLEDEMGHISFLGFYLGCGSLAALLHGLLNARSYAPLIGASGAIAGVLGAYFILYPRTRIRSLVPLFFFFFTVNVPAVIFLGFWFLLQLTQGTFADVASNVAYAAHIGGFIIGMAVGIAIRRGRRRRRSEIELYHE